jgi:hypothetical protein
MPMTTSDEAVPTDEQPKKPCHDCPWRRESIKGWLGAADPDDWLIIAHSDEPVPCHAIKGPQCAGLAIYRANMCKLPRDRAVLRLPADRETVFATPAEFLAHHARPAPKNKR